MNKKLFNISYIILTIVIFVLAIKSFVNLEISTTFLAIDEVLNEKSIISNTLLTFLLAAVEYGLLYFAISCVHAKKTLKGIIKHSILKVLSCIYIIAFIIGMIFTIFDLSKSDTSQITFVGSINYFLLIISPLVVIATIKNLIIDNLTIDNRSFVVLFLTILFVSIGNIISCFIKKDIPCVGNLQTDYYLFSGYLFIFEYVIYILMSVYLLLTKEDKKKKKIKLGVKE